MKASFGRCLVGSTAAALCTMCLLGTMCLLATHLLANDLDYEIFSGEPAVETARSRLEVSLSSFDIFSGEPAVEAARSKPEVSLSSFDIFSSEPAVLRPETGLDCDLFRGSPQSRSSTSAARTTLSSTSTRDGRPLVYVYESPGCLPCVRLKRALETAAVAFRVEYRPRPDWVQSTPTLHWRTDRGWLQYTPVREGAAAINEFEREWRRER